MLKIELQQNKWLWIFLSEFFWMKFQRSLSVICLFFSMEEEKSLVWMHFIDFQKWEEKLHFFVFSLSTSSRFSIFYFLDSQHMCEIDNIIHSSIYFNHFLCIWNPFYYYFLSIFITLVFSFYIKTSVHVFVMVAFKILALFVVSGFCFVFIHLKKIHQCTQNKIGFPNQMLKPRIKKLWKLVWI